MSKIIVNPNYIVNNYTALDEYLGKNLDSTEGNLYIKDNKVYKIYKDFNETQVQVLNILEQNKFPDCRNIEDVLVFSQQIFGSTTDFDPNWQSFNDYLQNMPFDLYEKKQIFKLFEQVIGLLAYFHLGYEDVDVFNVGLSNQKLVLGDLDGCEYTSKTLDELVRTSCIQTFYFSILLEDNLSEKIVIFNNFLKEILKPTFSDLYSLVQNMTQIEYDAIKGYYKQYLRKY